MVVVMQFQDGTSIEYRGQQLADMPLSDRGLQLFVDNYEEPGENRRLQWIIHGSPFDVEMLDLLRAAPEGLPFDEVVERMVAKHGAGTDRRAVSEALKLLELARRLTADDRDRVIFRDDGTVLLGGPATDEVGDEADPDDGRERVRIRVGTSNWSCLCGNRPLSTEGFISLDKDGKLVDALKAHTNDVLCTRCGRVFNFLTGVVSRRVEPETLHEAVRVFWQGG